MSIEKTKISKGLTVEKENTLTPASIDIIPGGTAGTKTTITSTQTSNISVDLKHLNGLTEDVTATYVRVDSKAQPSGVASLDVTGKIPNSQLPTTAMEYFGNWNASTNTPTLADGVGSAGDVYRASAAGTVDFGSGPIVFNISDWAVYSGSVWQQSPSPGAVSSVFGRTGAVLAQSGDYTKAQVGLSNVDNTSDVNKPVSTAQQTYIDNRMPTGAVIPFAGSSAPTGYLICNGLPVSRTTYANLFAVIGTTYGVGDGSTTFGIPDMAGRTAIGVGTHNDAVAGILVRTLNQVLGFAAHILTSNEMPSHTHIQNSHNHTTPFQYSGVTGGAPLGYGDTIITGATATGSTTATNQNTGGDAMHNNMQPSVALNYIIRT